MFAVLHIADFALQAVLRTEAQAAQRAAALFSGAGKKSLVIAANPFARAAGVECGMTAPQAVARCPALVIRAPNRAAEAEARAALLAVGFTLSPAIEDTAPGICTIDLRGLMSAPEPIAAAALEQLARLGLAATGGIARTPLLALYGARAAQARLCERAGSRQEDSAVCESRASSLPPLCRVTNEKNFLAPLPLAAADPSPALAAIFANWGLRTLGDLTALPRDEIVRRFGREGLALWQRASGGAMRPLEPFVPAQTFSAALEFEDAVETLEPLLFILRRFLDRLVLELNASQHVAAELQLTLKLEDNTHHARGFRLPEPTADVEILFRTLHTHLEALTTPAAIVALTLAITPARPLVRQQGLFETGLRDPHGFAETLARVSALVGAERVGTPQREDTHRPDAFKLTAPASVIAPPAPEPVHPPRGQPLRRFRPPLLARIEFTDEQPTFLWTEHVRGEIARRSPPWRSSGEWWQRDRAWARTEWDIALASGGLYRLLRVGESYFLEGEYD